MADPLKAALTSAVASAINPHQVRSRWTGGLLTWGSDPLVGCCGFWLRTGVDLRRVVGVRDEGVKLRVGMNWRSTRSDAGEGVGAFRGLGWGLGKGERWRGFIAHRAQVPGGDLSLSLQRIWARLGWAQPSDSCQ
jgi:hypothetical protein